MTMRMFGLLTLGKRDLDKPLEIWYYKGNEEADLCQDR